MSIYLILDLLLILLIVLFAPIGYWRGPVKELLVTFGVLFGILLADFWARPWGRDLADITAIGSSGGAFVVAMAFLVIVTFVLGYGAGAALAPTEFGPVSRTIGAIIALFNGTLLVAFSLQYVRVYLLSPSTEEALYDSYVVQFLLDEIGWVLLAAAVIAWPVLLAILITGNRAYEYPVEYVDYDYGPADDVDYDDYYEDEPMPVAYERTTVSSETRVYPPRVPASPPDESGHVYKAEPAAGAASPTEATRAIRVGDRWDEPDEPAADERQAMLSDDQTDPEMTIISADDEYDDDQAEDEPSAASGVEEDRDDLAPGYLRCSNCHAVLPPDVRVCPVCGEVN